MRWRKFGVIALAGVVLLAAWRLGVFRQLGEPRQLADTLVRLGPWGYVAFLVAYAVLQPFGIPGTIFVVAAPMIWPWPTAFALSMTGTMAASVVGFSFARFVARDFVAAKIPARFRRWDDALERRAFATVFMLRLIFWMPPVLHAFFGISKVRFWTHFWGSFVGYLAPLFAMSFFGPRMVDWMRASGPRAWIAMGVGAAVIGAAFWVRGRRAAPTPNG
ncbi:MAG TPA: VTT domain-containing protein [Polyangiaceae bacterium]|jgi:uncharacterized membrane protein YdjX (TVP38/TMEM64 family)